MFKPTQALFGRIRRLQLTTKQVNGGYYKGNRTGSMGRHTKHGNYVIEWHKVRTYVVPANLDNCKVCLYSTGFRAFATDLVQLSPFVTNTMERTKGKFEGGDGRGPMSGTRYLENWKEKNGVD